MALLLQPPPPIRGSVPDVGWTDCLRRGFLSLRGGRSMWSKTELRGGSRLSEGRNRFGRRGLRRRVATSSLPILLGAVFMALPASARAADFSGTVRNVTCSGTITNALQTAIDSSSDNDVVNISAGSCSSAQVAWSNKNIKVQGQGIGTTTV